MFADELLIETGRSDYLEALKAKEPGEAPSWPGGNAIKRGEASEFPRVAEDATALITRAQECFQGLIPQNGWHGWLIDQMALTTLRLDRCGRADRRMRDRVTIRAALGWDEERMGRAEMAGKGLAVLPRAVVADLRSSPHGCDWLIRRWAVLGRAAEAGKGWNEAQLALAHDLLGTPTEGRDGEPGLTFGGKDGTVASVPDRAELARREIAGLKRRKGEVMHWDAIDRAMVEADLLIEPTPELRQLGRHEARLRNWLKWLLAQIRIDAPKRLAPAGLYPRLPEAEPEEKKPEPEPAPIPAPAPAPKPEASEVAEAEAEVDVEPKTFGCHPSPRLAPGTREDPKATRDEARREAKRRKRDRRRA